VVIGAQRTGINILREILNTNDEIAMLGEVFSPSGAPAHWENFLRVRGSRFPPANAADAEALLDEYFEFVEYRIRHHWAGNAKSKCRAVGIDIKYDQLRRVTPAGWNPGSPPFLIGYLRSRDTILVHTIRTNVIRCALSEIIAEKRDLWHNYGGNVIDRSYYVDAEDCRARAQRLVLRRSEFREFARGCRVVDSNYEDLADEITRAIGGRIQEGPGPLRDIAETLGVRFGFNYDGRLKRAIDIPYSRLISNHAELQAAVSASEFSALADTLK